MYSNYRSPRNDVLCSACKQSVLNLKTFGSKHYTFFVKLFYICCGSKHHLVTCVCSSLWYDHNAVLLWRVMCNAVLLWRVMCNAVLLWRVMCNAVLLWRVVCTSLTEIITVHFSNFLFSLYFSQSYSVRVYYRVYKVQTRYVDPVFLYLYISLKQGQLFKCYQCSYVDVCMGNTYQICFAKENTTHWY